MENKNFDSIQDFVESLEESSPGITEEFNKRNKARETTKEIRLGLKQLRKDNNMSTKDVAEKLDIHEVDVLKFESGTSTVLLETTIRYAEIFGKKLWHN